jgi:hypothetical protein
MTFPKFESHLLFGVKEKTFNLLIENFLIKKLENTSITITSEIIEDDEIIAKDEWINQAPIIGIYINDFFLEYHENKNPELDIFYEHLKATLEPLANISKPIYEQLNFPLHKPFVFLTVYYKTNENLIFKFLFDGKERIDELIDSINKVFDLLITYKKDNNEELKKSIQSSFTQNNQIKYFIFDIEWMVLNPLIEISKEINEKYLKDKDNRVSKPHILMQRDNYSKYIILDSNWVLEFEGLETMLIKPNDVSLYSSISIKNRIEAEKFYNEVIIKRLKEYGGAFPSYEKQTEYYNYFELVITSLIFSYTSLEAFANICIPNNYEYITDKGGIKTIYSKVAIERKFPLRDKFKDILAMLLKMPKITNEKWWNDFIKLEDIRNEIIHTKEASSEERYSKLLTNDIFDLINVHLEIISFFGLYISQNKQEIMSKFPYSFGYDEFIPSLSSKENFDKSRKVIYGR